MSDLAFWLLFGLTVYLVSVLYIGHNRYKQKMRKQLTRINNNFTSIHIQITRIEGKLPLPVDTSDYQPPPRKELP